MRKPKRASKNMPAALMMRPFVCVICSQLSSLIFFMAVVFFWGATLLSEAQSNAVYGSPDISALNTYSRSEQRAFYINQLEDVMESRQVLTDFNAVLWKGATLVTVADNSEYELDELLSFLEAEPDHLVVRWYVAERYARLGQIQNALPHFEQLLSQAPLFSRGYLSRAQLWVERENYDLAFADFRLALNTHQLLESDHLNAYAGALQAGARRSDLMDVVISLNQARNLGKRIQHLPKVQVNLLRHQQQLKETFTNWYALYGLDSAPKTRGGQLLSKAFDLMWQGEAAQTFDLLFTANRSGIFSSRQASALEQRTYARLLALSAVWANKLEDLQTFLQKGAVNRLGLMHRVVLAYAGFATGCAAEAELSLLSPEGKLLDTKAVGQEEAAAYYLSVIDLAIHAGDLARSQTAARLLVQITQSPDFGLQLAKMGLENGWESPALTTLQELLRVTTSVDYARQPQTWTALFVAMADLSLRTEQLEQAKRLLKEAHALSPTWQISAKRGQVALQLGQIHEASKTLQGALGQAREARRSIPFTPTQKTDYARLYFDLASFSALHNDWHNTFIYLLRDWSISRDPALIAPAYILLSQSTASDQQASEWYNVVEAHLKEAELTQNERVSYALQLLVLARILRDQQDQSVTLQIYTLVLELYPSELLRMEAAQAALQLEQPFWALQTMRPLQEQARPSSSINGILCQASKRLKHLQTSQYCKQRLPQALLSSN